MTLTPSLSVEYTSAMVNISIFQSEDDNTSPSITLPDSFIALKSTSTASRQFLQVVERFLQDKKSRTLTELRGQAAAEVADFLDELIKELNGEPKLRRGMIRFLRPLCGSWGILPASYTLEGEVTITWDRSARTSTYRIFSGTWGSEKVAVKVMKIRRDVYSMALKRQLAREVVIWKQLKHRNLLPLYGVTIVDRCPCFVSPWMEDVNICTFVRNNSTFNRFNLLVDACEGLTYLHSEGFFHGKLKSDNVLVDKENRACLAGFDLQDTANYSTSYSMSMDQHNHDTWQGAYAAPETFDEKAFNERLPVPKVPADVHSFGVLIYEVLAGQLPFHVFHREVIKFPRPPWSTLIPNHPIWRIAEQCWNLDPAKRPQLADTLRTLKLASMFPPAEWPSPPTTAPQPSIPNTSPRSSPTPPIPATVISDLSPATPTEFSSPDPLFNFTTPSILPFPSPPSPTE